MVFSLSAEERLASVERFVVGFMAQERELQHVVKDVTTIKKDLDEMKTSLQNVTFMCRVRAEERQLEDTVKYVESIKSEIKACVEDMTSFKASMKEISARVPSNEVPQLTTGEEVNAEVAITFHKAQAGDAITMGNRSNGEALEVVPAEQAGSDGRVIEDMPDRKNAERFSALESRVVKLEADLSGVSSLMQDCTTELSGVADPNDQVVQELQSLPKEQVLDAAQTRNEQSKRFEYKVEESIYGLLVLPTTPLRFSICLLLLVLYTLTTGLVFIIYQSTVAAANSTRAALYAGSDEIDPICQRMFQGDSYTWVCSPPILMNLMDFDRLDTNADGQWSVGEARNAGLLAQFRALNEVALEQRDMLEGIFPHVRPKHSSFCQVLLNVAHRYSNQYQYLSEMDHLWMFFSERKHSFEEVETILGHCNLNKSLSEFDNPAVWSTSAPMEWGSFECITRSLCDPIPIVPGNTSEALFYANTSFMAFMPKSLHEALSLKMLRPCRLLDPELCANAEHQAHPLLSEVWPDLPLDLAVRKCSAWVKDVCPRLLGEGFRAIQARMSVACGPRSYEIFEKTATMRGRVSQTSRVSQCTDPEDGGLAAMQVLGGTLFTQQPLMTWVTYGEEAKAGFPRGTVQAMLDCKLGVSGFGFNEIPLEVNIDSRSATIASFFGERCPESSCARVLESYGARAPTGCPAECLEKIDSANNVKDPFNISFGPGSYTQMGWCEQFKTEVDGASGSLKISRLEEIDPYNQELCEMVLHLDKPARVYVTTWNLPSRLQMKSDAGLCFGDYLEIDGQRHCGAQKPAVVNLQPRPGPFEAVIWSTCSICGEFDDSAGFDKSLMGFEMIITDASVPTQYPLVTVSFENHLWYWEDIKGVQRPFFNAFLVLIMLIWIGFLSDELEKQFLYVRYINNQFKSFIRKSLLLFFLALPRFLVWAFVLYTGILLLATADSYIDLVLNSVALAFVLEFDEYLFVMAVPDILKEQVKTFDPILLEAKLPRPRRLTLPGSGRAYDVQITFRMLCFLVVAVVVVQALYGVDWLGSPHFTRISEVYDCLCALRGPNCPAY